MDRPFLEISVISTTDTKYSRKDLLLQIGKGFEALYGKDFHFIENSDLPYIRIDFPSVKAFEKIYEKPYSMFVYIFEHFITENETIAALFESSKSEPEDPGQEFDGENYLVLHYRSNCLDPMRQYYFFTAKINKFFGAQVENEEIQDGFLRFIHTKEDFEILLVPGDIVDAWKEIFRIRNVDLNHPLIEKFFHAIESWKNSN